MRKILLVALLLCVSATALPLQAKTVTIKKYYEGSFVTWNRVGRADPTCTAGKPPCTLTKDGQIDIGAVEFDPIRGRKSKYDVTIRVVDEYDPFGKVSMSACEDTNASNTCGSTDRVWVNTCLARNQKLVLRGVKKTNPVRVTIQRAYSCTQYVNDVPDDQGGGVSGYVTLSYVK